MSDSTPICVVTGAAGNLERVVVARLRETGVRAVEVERNTAHANDVGLGDVELGRLESVQALFGRVLERFGRLDSVIHTVGSYRGARLLETSADDVRAMFDTNVITTLHVLRAAIPIMLPAARGSVVTVASGDALQGAAGRSAYAASKAAQLRLIESAAEELQGSGVRVNCVLPGTLDTAQNRTAQPNADRSRWVSVEAVADVLVYLASPAAAAIHGEAIRLGRS